MENKKKFHILYKSNQDSFYAEGENIEANSIIESINAFNILYPNAIILAIYTEDLIILKQ